MHFASDNASGVTPEVLEALVAAAEGWAPSYGGDRWTEALQARMAEAFEHEVSVYPVVSGTAANALALSVLTPPWGLVLCHENAHVYVDEAGAPEHLSGGARLHPLPGEAGRIDLEALSSALARVGHGVHSSPPSALTMTQLTEAGTLYSPEGLAERADLARRHGLGVHLDGARLANAVVALGCSPAEISWRIGVDVVSFGATKNGAMDVDAVVFFDPARAGSFERHRKRAGHLVSKMRFLSAQLLACLEDDRWLRWAGHANRMATRLARGLTDPDTGVPGASLAVPTEGNEVFVSLPRPVLERLRVAGATFYEEAVAGTVATRLVASWSTTPEEVDRFLAVACDEDSAMRRTPNRTGGAP